MADSDVFGILSLLLAAGGAAYLIRAWLSRSPKTAVPTEPSERPDDRTRTTVAPKLRPPSPPPVPVARPHRGERPSSNAPKVGPAKVGPAKVGPAKVGPAKVAPAKVAPAKVAPAKVGAAPPTSTEVGRVAGPSSKTPDVAPKAAGSSPKREAKPAVPAAPAPKKKPADVVDVPRIEFEDDEDVEPTKVGRNFKQSAIQPPVEKILFDDGADADGAREKAPLLVVYSLAQTDPGKRRKQNEDSLLILDEQGVFVVADGMGGHRGGQLASRLAVKTMGDAFEAKRFEAAPHADLPPPASELARAIQMANAAIHEEASKQRELKGMGTTLCAARFTSDNRRMYLGHVGDSRCYRLRNRVMKQMTRDHTMADYGVAGPEGAHLSRALGVWPTVPIDVVMASPKLGDLYLLCSDGLTKMLPDETIATQLLHEEDPKAAVERLVFFANAHGGKDNITVILMRVVEPGWKPPLR